MFALELAGGLFAVGLIAFVVGMFRHHKTTQHDILSEEVIGLAIMMASLWGIATWLAILVLTTKV